MSFHGYDPGDRNNWYQSPQLGLFPASPTGYGGGYSCLPSYHPHSTQFPSQPSYPPPPYQFPFQPSYSPPPPSQTIINGYVFPHQFPSTHTYHSPDSNPNLWIYPSISQSHSYELSVPSVNSHCVSTKTMPTPTIYLSAPSPPVCEQPHTISYPTPFCPIPESDPSQISLETDRVPHWAVPIVDSDYSSFTPEPTVKLKGAEKPPSPPRGSGELQVHKEHIDAKLCEMQESLKSSMDTFISEFKEELRLLRGSTQSPASQADAPLKLGSPPSSTPKLIPATTEASSSLIPADNGIIRKTPVDSDLNLFSTDVILGFSDNAGMNHVVGSTTIASTTTLVCGDKSMEVVGGVNTSRKNNKKSVIDGFNPEESKEFQALLYDGIDIHTGYLGDASTDLSGGNFPQPKVKQHIYKRGVERASLLFKSMSQFNDIDFLLNPSDGNRDCAVVAVDKIVPCTKGKRSHFMCAQVENINEQDSKELLNSFPCQEEYNIRSKEDLDEVEASSIPPLIPCMPFAMKLDHIQQSIGSFLETVIAVNTQNLGKERIVFRRSTYQKILAMEKKGARVIECDSELPVDNLLSSTICLVWYNCRNIGKNTTALDEASSCLPLYIESIATNVLILLSITFCSCMTLKKQFHKHINSVLQVTKSILQSAIDAVTHDSPHETAIPSWKEVFYSLVMLEKILNQFHDFCVDRDLKNIWEAFSVYLCRQLKTQLVDDAANKLITQNMAFILCSVHSLIGQTKCADSLSSILGVCAKECGKFGVKEHSDGFGDKENVVKQPVFLLGDIIKTPLYVISEIIHVVPHNLDSFSAYLPPSRYDIDTTAELSNANCTVSLEDICGIARLALGLVSYVGAMYTFIFFCIFVEKATADTVKLTSEFLVSCLDVIPAIKKYLNDKIKPWLDGTFSGNGFLHDSKWGGIVTEKGLADLGADYNDHHYHLGYFIYVIPMISKIDLAWGKKYMLQAYSLDQKPNFQQGFSNFGIVPVTLKEVFSCSSEMHCFSLVITIFNAGIATIVQLFSRDWGFQVHQLWPALMMKRCFSLPLSLWDNDDFKSALLIKDVTGGNPYLFDVTVLHFLCQTKAICHPRRFFVDEVIDFLKSNIKLSFLRYYFDPLRPRYNCGCFVTNVNMSITSESLTSLELLLHEYQIDPVDVKAVVASAIIQLQLYEATESYKRMDRFLRAFGICISFNQLVNHHSSNGPQDLIEQLVDIEFSMDMYEATVVHWLANYDEGPNWQGAKRTTTWFIKMHGFHHISTNKVPQQHTCLHRLQLVLRKLIQAETQGNMDGSINADSPPIFSCFDDLALTMILYSLWLIRAWHKSMGYLPFEDSNYPTTTWFSYIFLGLGVTLCSGHIAADTANGYGFQMISCTAAQIWMQNVKLEDKFV